jgi:PAS domain S-box-containing protein
MAEFSETYINVKRDAVSRLKLTFARIAGSGQCCHSRRSRGVGFMHEDMETLSGSLSPFRILLTVLLIVFAAEFSVMLVMPKLAPRSTEAAIMGLVDASLLTLCTAPVLWWVIIGPLRRTTLAACLRESSIVRTAADGIITIDDAGVVRSFSSAAQHIFGYAGEQVIGKPLTMLMPTSITAEHEKALRRYLEQRSPNVTGRSIETVGLRKDGVEIPLAVSISGVRVGGQLALTGIVRDLTDARRAEAELKARAAQQSAVAELGRRALAGIDLSILLIDAVEMISQTLGVRHCILHELEPNSKRLLCRAATGFDEQDISGNPTCRNECRQVGCDLLADDLAFNELIGPQTKCGTLCWLRDRDLVDGTSLVIQGYDKPFGVLGVYTTRPRSFTKDEKHFLRSTANVITIALTRHRTELDRQERATLRAEQMAAVAQVATGVAHEIRNPLTSIKMLVQSNEAQLRSHGLPSEDLQLIEQEIRRMERSLNEFIDYARPAKSERRQLDLNEIAQGTIALIGGRARRRNVEMRFVPSNPSITVEADEGQLQQLFLNLSLNALDAMPRGGVLRLEINTSEGSDAVLSVRDTGPGIAAEVIDRMFEPFVTTKETGLGLGLIVCRRIAEDHGGTLFGHNESPQGACFELRMPGAPNKHH